MSYDFDFMIADHNEDSLIIISGMNYYSYTLSSTMDLFEGGKDNGVEYEEYGNPEEEEWGNWEDWEVDWEDREGW